MDRTQASSGDARGLDIYSLRSFSLLMEHLNRLYPFFGDEEESFSNASWIHRSEHGLTNI
jgi:hypothetical protein